MNGSRRYSLCTRRFGQFTPGFLACTDRRVWLGSCLCTHSCLLFVVLTNKLTDEYLPSARREWEPLLRSFSRHGGLYRSSLRCQDFHEVAGKCRAPLRKRRQVIQLCFGNWVFVCTVTWFALHPIHIQLKHNQLLHLCELQNKFVWFSI